MKLLGDWKGVTYFERIHNYIPDNPLILCIETVDEKGNVKGKVTEIIFDQREAKRLEEYKRNTFIVSGHFEAKSGELSLKEVIASEQGNENLLKGNFEIIAEVDLEKEIMRGKFYNCRWKENAQVLELSKCHFESGKSGYCMGLKTFPLIDALADEICNNAD
ncbi:MAG: hypothetical protein VB095_06150 [Anaerovorax sp.]|nr:hypothetical protein [Anaerovorax sp.]